MIKIIVIFAFFLEGLLSVYQGPTIFNIITFKPMFTIISLLLVYPLCYKKLPYYYKLCLITGLAYDLLYTNTLMLNMLIFLLLGCIINIMYQYLPLCLINTFFINIIILSIYHVLTFLILCSIGYLPFDISNLSYNFINIIVTNTFFLIIFYSILSNKIKKSKYSL